RRALGEELRSLLGMARQVTTSTGITELLHHVVEQAAALVGVESAALALVHEDGMVRFDEVWRNGSWQPFRSVRPLDMGVLGRTAARGMPEWHNTLTPELHYDHDAVAALDLRSLLCVPLRDRLGMTFGVLALGNKRGVQDFQQNDIGLVQAFADLAASAIENVRSFDATEEARAYQRALMEQARDAILVADPVSGRLVDVNLAMEQLTGYTHADMIRLTTHDLGLGTESLSGAVDGESAAGVPRVPIASIRRRDGACVAVELSASYVQTQRGPRLLVIVRDIEDRLAAAAEMRRRNEELEARNAVAALLTQSNSIETALSSVLPSVVEAGEVTGALVMLTDESWRLRVAASVGVPAIIEEALRNSPVQLDERFAGRIAASRKPLVINDISTVSASWPATYAAGLGSLALLPLVANNRTLGTLGAGSVLPEHFDEQRIARLRAFADQIAVWLDSRLSLEEAQRREQDARFVADLGESLNQGRDEQEIVRRLAEGIAAKFGGGVMVLLRDFDSETWRLAASAHPDPRRVQFMEQLLAAGPWSGEGVPHALLAERNRPRLLNFAAGDRLENEQLNEMMRTTGSQTLIVMPMTAGAEMVGMFAATDGGGQPAFTQRHLALAQQIAQHAAIAVANARAYRESRQSHAFLRAMMEQAGEAILVLDAASGQVVEANVAAEGLTGHSRPALIGLGWDELVQERDRSMLRRTIAGLARTGRGTRRRVLRLRRADGRPLTAH
ncbi:MAG: GAF domain-containing protein, partial [Dehalococcoidia bacterium]